MKLVVTLLIMFLFFPLISADVIINQQPQGIYNLHNVIEIPVTVKSTSGVSGILNIDLLCGSSQVNFYKNGVSLSSGEERVIESSLVLTKSVIGDLKGTCKVKAFIEDDFALSNEFRISDLINVFATLEKLEFSPKDSISISGEATRENGESVDGFVELLIIEGNQTSLSQLGTVSNGAFTISTSVPNDMAAGAYLLRLKVYERDSLGQITNNGFTDHNIHINQVPTNLEIVFENSEVEPGTNLRVKAILRDQTGEKIQSTSFITIKNKNDKILQQTEVATDEFLEFPVTYNEFPSTWTVVAVSNKITNEATLQILEKESIEMQITNNTLTITNTGNVPYNKTALIKIGDETLNVDVYLEVDESQKYIISAPNGEYNIGVATGGVTAEAENILLTGKSVEIRKAPGRIGGLLKYPIAWIFVILILGFVTLIVFKRGYQKTFIGYITSKVKHKPGNVGGSAITSSTSKSLINPRNRAELSLSIKGDKQNVSLVTLNVKNLKEIHGKESSVKDTFQKLVHIAEEHKAAVYENNNFIFFILAPIQTKTFKNESTALNIAQKMEKTLANHNRMFKQRIDFGISMSYGTIVAKHDTNNNVLKFMSMGNLMTMAKKTSSVSNSEILLDEKIHEKLRSEVKAIKNHKSGINVYSIKEIKNVEEHRKFIKHFLHKAEQEKGEKPETSKEIIRDIEKSGIPKRIAEKEEKLDERSAKKR